MDQALAHTLAAIRRADWDGAVAAALVAMPDGRLLPRPAVPLLVRLVRALAKAGRLPAARILADRLVAAAPAEPAAYLARSLVAQRLGDLDLAIVDTQAAMSCAADPAAGALRLVDLLYEAGRMEEASGAVIAALAAAGDELALLARLADIADALGDRAGMTDALDRALVVRRRQGFGSSHLLFALLRAGRLADAVADLDLRWAASGAPPRPFPQPQWDGGGAPDGHLLVWGEQGLGEEIWTAALLPQAAARVGRVTLEAAPRLAALFARSFPAVAVVPRGDPPAPECRAAGFQVGAVGLLRALAAGAEPHPPHLRPDRDAVDRLRARYRGLGSAPVIGISWRSANRHAPRAKSTSLLDWAPILSRPAIFVDLQYGDTEADRAAAERALGVRIHRDPAIDPLGDLDPVAAQMAAMDAVITVSNTTAHLAGGLGVPSAVLLPRGRGQVWCWLDGTRSWYAGQRICRQDRPGEWAAAIGRAAALLDELLARRP